MLSLPRILLFVVAATAPSVAQNYTYDVDGVLRQVDYGATNRIRYSFDAGGNLLAVQGPTRLELWRYQNFATLDPSGAAADDAAPASDGVPNLVKYALGLDPKLQSSQVNMSQLLRTPTGAEFYYWARTSDPNLIVTAQQSLDLKSWSTDSSGVAVVGTNGSINLHKVIYNNPDLRRQFWRILIRYAQ